jgi:hypothetical protein
MDGIVAYANLFKQFGYVSGGSGTTAWSHRVTKTDGSTIEYRGTDWSYTGPRGSHTGRNATDLKAFLLSDLSREELVKLLMAA